MLKIFDIQRLYIPTESNDNLLYYHWENGRPCLYYAISGICNIAQEFFFHATGTSPSHRIILWIWRSSEGLRQLSPFVQPFLHFVVLQDSVTGSDIRILDVKASRYR